MTPRRRRPGPPAEGRRSSLARSLRGLPWKTLTLLAAAGLGLAVLNHLLHRAGLPLDTPDPWFPISVFWARFHASGWPWLAVFGLLLSLAAATRRPFGRVWAWLLGLGFLLSANLIQGSAEAAFFEPFTESHPGVFQYYHDAVEIEASGRWLQAFNASQETFHLHTRTHPPFAVLVHRPGLELGGTTGLFLSFLLIASLTVPLVWEIFRHLGVPPLRRCLLALLLAALPAFNIYGAVTLDAVIAATATLFLLGLVRSLTRGVDGRALAALACGLLLTNALTFAGVFLLPVLAAAALWRRWRGGRWDLVFTCGGLVLLAALAQGALAAGLGYDHLEAFRTASRLENPEGYLLLAEPLNFVMTRLESVCELALFFSLPALALLVAGRPLGVRPRELSDPGDLLALAAITTVGAMLLAGTFRTGETARACLFLYPYLLLPLRTLDAPRLRAVLLFAGLQTAAMQLVGDFFW